MKVIKKQRLAPLLGIFLGLVSFTGCEKDTATSGTVMTLSPTSIDIGAGNLGDTTFVIFVVDLTDGAGVAVNQVEITATASVARILTEEGTFADSGTPVILSTDDNGQAIFTIEVPLGVEFEEGILVRSGSTNNVFNLTVSPLA